MHFYPQTATGAYIAIQADTDGIIRSQILPGFQFRRRDLKRLPTLEELALDPVYKGYILLHCQTAAKEAEQERQQAERYAVMLREMGID